MAELKDELRLLHKAYKDVFGGESGKLVLEDLRARGFFHASTWAGDKEQTLINEGARQLVLHINTMVEYDLEQLEKLFEPEEEGEGF